MFFLFSKLFSFLISPLIWIITLIFVALFSHSKKKKRYSLIIALALLLFFSNSFILMEVLRLWETGYVKTSELKTEYDYGIILGGMGEYDAKYNRVNFNVGADRLIHAAYLYNAGLIKNLIITSGSGSVLHQNIKEADYIKEYAIRLGVPDSCIIIENQSRNTHENAVFTYEITKRFKPNTSYLLITSAFHMRRAKACFEKAGFKIDAFAVTKLAGKRKYEFDHLFLPDIDTFYFWDTLIHEMVGFVIYNISGFA